MGEPGGQSRNSSNGGDLRSQGRRGRETRAEREQTRAERDQTRGEREESGGEREQTRAEGEDATPRELADGEYPVSREQSRRPPERGFPGSPEPKVPPEPGRASPFQFSLGELLLLFVLSAVALGSFQMLPPEEAAGLAGLIALVSLIVLLMIPTPRPSLFLAWWTILANNVVTAAVAVFRAS